MYRNLINKELKIVFRTVKHKIFFNNEVDYGKSKTWP